MGFILFSKKSPADHEYTVVSNSLTPFLLPLSPLPSMFDPEVTGLDRKKSISIEDLHQFHTTFKPLGTCSADPSPSHYTHEDRRVSKATVAAQTMVTISVPSPDYNFYSSSDSIHSAISN